MRQRTLEQSTYIMKEQMGDEHMSLHDIKQRIQRGDNCSENLIVWIMLKRGTSLNTGPKDQESLKL